MNSPSSRPTPSAAQVLSISELVHLIASFNTTTNRGAPIKALSIDRTDLVRLSQVCRRTFDILIPEVWENVKGAQNLLGLIKSASLVYDGQTRKLRDVLLPSQFTPDDSSMFERFDLYAPCVKTLDVYGKNTEAYGVRGWSNLIARSQAHPLLPRLNSILFWRDSSPGHESDEIMWITCFGSVATTHIFTPFDHWDPGMFPYSAASDLLEAIVKSCPNVETLGLHPWDSESESTPNDSAPSKPWYKYLESLTRLHRLSISEGWLYHPSLQTLARIPQLKGLEIHPGDYKGFDVLYHLDTTLPPHSFPVLSDLWLRQNCPRTTAQMLSIRGMLEHIIHLFIELGPGWGSEDDEENGGCVIDLFPLLSNTPCLEHLAIKFDPGDTDNVVYSIWDVDVLDTLLELPLKTVDLTNMHLGTGALGVNLGIIWPNVTKLSMPHQYASLQELWYFATLPKLQRLTLMFDLTTTFAPANIPYLPHTPHCALVSSIGSRISSKFSIIAHNAEIIAQYWPYARFVRLARQPGDRGDRGWSELVSFVDHLISGYSIIYGTETPTRKNEAGKVLAQDRDSWMRQMEEDSGPEFVYVYKDENAS